MAGVKYSIQPGLYSSEFMTSLWPKKEYPPGGETHKKGRRTGLEHVLVYDANEKVICVMGTWRNVAQSNA